MLFNSLHFLVFFPLVTAAYFLLPARTRWVLLLAASYYFYMCWRVEYIFLIVITTLSAYLTGLIIAATPDRRRKRLYLAACLCVNFAILFVFKYFNMMNDTVRLLFRQVNIFYNVPSFSLLLPVGISFYTFQTLSYTIDVYRGAREPERHPGIFALYVAFFPQLVAGPIERSGRLLPQFHRPHRFEYDRVVSGLRLMMWGFFKKVVIADRLSVYVNWVYNAPDAAGPWQMVFATYFFAIQIYCDFSGYSDIAIGTARVMGYDLMKNFRRPYFAASVREFWQRWHISLTTWFRDYLYFPLGGNRVPAFRRWFNVLTVFLVSGLWHGANWTFVLWGGVHGLFLLVSGMTERLRGYLPRNLPAAGPVRLLKMVCTFHLVAFAWIFFRANSLADVRLFLQGITNGVYTGDGMSAALTVPGYSRNYFLTTVAVAAGIELIRMPLRKAGYGELGAYPGWLRWAAYLGAFFVIFMLGNFGKVEFIYFQF